MTGRSSRLPLRMRLWGRWTLWRVRWSVAHPPCTHECSETGAAFPQCTHVAAHWAIGIGDLWY